MERKSRGQEVKWTGSDRNPKSGGSEVTWTESYVKMKSWEWQSRGQEVTWSGSHVDRKWPEPEVTWTGCHVDPPTYKIISDCWWEITLQSPLVIVRLLQYCDGILCSNSLLSLEIMIGWYRIPCYWDVQ